LHGGTRGLEYSAPAGATQGRQEPVASSPRRWLVPAALGALLLLRVAFWLLAPPNSDEAYYWLWGLHPALSYFDHPPLNAWIQGLVHAILGRSLLALRLPAAVTTAGSVWLLARMSGRLSGRAAPEAGLVAAVVLASPLLVMMTSFAWQDHLLVFLVLLSASLFLDVFAEVAAGGRGSTGRLLAAGAALGLAALAKYSAVFLAAGVAAAVLWDRRLRPLLRQPRLYLSALACLAALGPVIAWNATHGLASFRFHTENRLAHLSFLPGGIPHLLGPTLLFLSPALALAMAAWLRPGAAAPGSYASVHRRLALAVFTASSGFFLVLSLFAWSLYYWNVVAYLLLLVPAAAWLAERPRLLAVHLGYGVVVAAAMLFHGAVVPLSALVPGVQDDDTFELYGWDGVARAVREEQRPGEVLVAADYRPASHLSWALGGPEVAVLCPRPSEFDFWDRPALRPGDPALLLTDAREPMTPELAARFERVQLVRTVPVDRLGVHLKDYELWRADGFRGRPER
jgi:4-amino-4-deoxy-L-arabinose transferase-like glycosyltransferase